MGAAFAFNTLEGRSERGQRYWHWRLSLRTTALYHRDSSQHVDAIDQDSGFGMDRGVLLKLSARIDAFQNS